jgi:hypothetical protein
MKMTTGKCDVCGSSDVTDLDEENQCCRSCGYIPLFYTPSLQEECDAAANLQAALAQPVEADERDDAVEVKVSLTEHDIKHPRDPVTGRYRSHHKLKAAWITKRRERLRGQSKLVNHYDDLNNFLPVIVECSISLGDEDE